MPENLSDILSKSELKPLSASALRSGQFYKAVALQNADLGSTTFKELDLEQAYMTKVNFVGAHLTKLKLYQSLFDSCILSNSNLSAGSFDSVEIHRSQVTGTDFSDANLSSFLFQRCRMDLSIFHGSQISACRFTKCDLRDADFQNARLKNVVFRDCDLRNARFPATVFHHVDLRGSQITGIYLESKQLQAVILDATQLTDLAGILGITVDNVPSDEKEVAFQLKISPSQVS
jgi:uncharacterized protein YjbI with pentapeptide repeats